MREICTNIAVRVSYEFGRVKTQYVSKSVNIVRSDLF